MRTDLPLVLPLACGEISPAVRHALRYAGVPCLDVEPASRSPRIETRFLLTDSRPRVLTGLQPGVSSNIKSLSHSGRSRVIDVQSILDDMASSTADYHTLEFTENCVTTRREEQGSTVTVPPLATPIASLAEPLLIELKSIVEKHGGIWARVADFPYPYRAAVCEGSYDELARLIHLLGRTSLRLSDLHVADDGGLMKSSYFAGGLMLRPRIDSTRLADEEHDTKMPLLWRTNCKEFSAWWRIREALSFSLARNREALSVTFFGEPQHWRPAIDIWKRNHLATLPWSRGECIWKSGLHVWRHERHKHPAGLFCLARLNAQAHPSRYQVTLKQSA